MSIEKQQLEATIAAVQAQGGVLGAALVQAALAPLQARLAELNTLAGEPNNHVEAVQTLRQVTILFLDVVNSTSLSQSLDPEDVHTVMDGTLARCTGIVTAHQGRVLNYAGDGLLAVFGADEVRQDDAERAVLAGLVLLEEGHHEADRVRKRHQLAGFNVRVGLHTGVVLLGSGLDGETSIHGFNVNVAARMEQSAPAGTMRISHDTYRHVRGVFDVTPQPLIEVKGVAAPMVTYLVRRCKPRAFRVATRGIEGIETRMVGRATELQQLQQTFESLYKHGTLRVISVVAEAGIGKSRLLYEFVNWAEAQDRRFYIFQGHAYPLTRSQPYGLLRDILAWRLQITDSDSMEVAKQKMESVLGKLLLSHEGADMAQAHAHLLGHLIGLDFSDSKHIKGIKDDGQQIRGRGFHAAAQMFRRIADQDGMPVVVLLDDLQYADAGSLDFLDHLCAVSGDLALLILSATRPIPRGWPSSGSVLAQTRRIVLAPLDQGISHALVDELLQKLPNIPVALRDLIVGGTEGNPFHMEELIKMLIDEGAIVTQDERWRIVPDKMLGAHVPQTLVGVLQARLDRLKPAERQALQQASVIGFVFWDQALAALDPRATQTLPSLVLHQLTVMHPGVALDAGVERVCEYAFAHQILHQVTYNTLLKRVRRKYHAQTACWLAGLGGARAKDFLGAAAEHFLQAQDEEQACEYFTRAAEHAASRFAHEAALEYVGKALALVPCETAIAPVNAEEQPLRHWRLLDVRERTLDLLGRRAEQQGDIQILQQLAEALHDDRRRCDVAWRKSTLALRTGDYHAMECAARLSVALADHLGDALLRLRAEHRLALALTYLGNASAGKALAQQGLTRARALGARQLEALFLNALSVIADSIVLELPSLEMDEQDLLINRELGNRRNEAIALGNLGSGWLRLGEPELAQRFLEEGLHLARAVGDRATQPNALANLSALALRQGDAALARTHAQAALAIALAVQTPEFEAIANCSLGNAELMLGRHSAALNAFERAKSVALELDNATQYDARTGLVRVALASNDLQSALQEVEVLLLHLAMADQREGDKSPLLVRLTCYQVLIRMNDPRAAALLLGAHAELQAQAASLDHPAQRQKFLENIPEHCQIVAAWSALSVAHEAKLQRELPAALQASILISR